MATSLTVFDRWPEDPVPEELESFCNPYAMSDHRERWEIPDLAYSPYVHSAHAHDNQVNEEIERFRVTKKDLRTKDLSPFYYGDGFSGVWIRLGVVPLPIDELPLVIKGVFEYQWWRLRRRGHIWVAEKPNLLR